MEESDGPAPAIDPSRLLPNIIRHCLSEGDASDLALDPKFMNARFRAHQIVRLMEFASLKLHTKLSISSVARAFEVSHSAVSRANFRGYQDPPGRGRHHELDPDAEQQMIDWIAKKAANHTAVNRTELLHECIERFGKSITRGWIDSFVTRHSEQLFETKSVPQENPRLEVPRAFLDAAVEGFRAHVHGACAELVFDLDEIGISEWEDRAARRVIVPSAMRGQTIFHSVHRNLKHISVVACISAAGEHMTPFFVCSQVNDAVERALKTQGFRMGIDLIIKRRNKPYVNSDLFHEYISTVLLPYIDELRTNDEFTDKEAVLLMDNCSVHVRSDILQILADHHVKVITFPPHTTHIFQSLDLSLFGTFKKKMNYKLPLESDETAAGFIKRIFHTMKQTLVEDNVRSAFVQLGLRYDIETIPYLLLFDEQVLRQSPGFTSLWAQDYPIEKLSHRRSHATFGWVNQTMCPEWNGRE
jgi:hypothetical protein